ncbi:ORF20 [Duck adenovirus 3]|uniref:ORF20 n=3 Tax=Duck aviadenovirus B TaxID=1534553 RepID=A0A7D4Y932_9ADEN|nr:ORF20 [Duck adenovirus 2]AYH52302.1 ORF20 [Duck adenovirus 3]QKW89995.1 ORF20 [Duck aviadenovirus B]QKX94125.1 ORF20 [Duck aviadenovirus B]UIY90294.1 ORF20 [Duck adenovirus 3]
MPLIPPSACVQASWSCGFKNECGVIWCSLLVSPLKPSPEVNSTYEILFSKAIGQMYTNTNPQLNRLTEQMMNMVICRCVKVIQKGSRKFRLMNVTIRIFTGVETSIEERHLLLRHVSRRLFFIPAGLYNDCYDLLSNKYPDYRFYTNGVLIREKRPLLMALRSMQFEVNATVVPPSIPFISHPLFYPKPKRSAPLGFLTALSAASSSVVTQPVFMKSMAKSVCHEELWPIIQQNMCYMPGIRHNVDVSGRHIIEHWTMHLHTKADDYHFICSNDCINDCGGNTVHSLQDICKLEILRLLFNMRRARVMNIRRSPFFHAFRSPQCPQ